MLTRSVMLFILLFLPSRLTNSMEETSQKQIEKLSLIVKDHAFANDINSLKKQRAFLIGMYAYYGLAFKAASSATGCWHDKNGSSFARLGLDDNLAATDLKIAVDALKVAAEKAAGCSLDAIFTSDLWHNQEMEIIVNDAATVDLGLASFTVFIFHAAKEKVLEHFCTLAPKTLAEINNHALKQLPDLSSDQPMNIWDPWVLLEEDITLTGLAPSSRIFLDPWLNVPKSLRVIKEKCHLFLSCAQIDTCVISELPLDTRFVILVIFSKI